MKKKVFSIIFALMLVVSLSLVTAVPVAAADITVGTGKTHATIQAAIDAAGSGDTIIVSDGTYTEDLTVNTSNFTIKSENGAASTTIQLVDGVGIDIQGGASGFTLGGATVEGFTITPHATNTTFPIQLANAPSGVEISYNTIATTGNASMGISVGAAGATGLTVNNNTFTADAGDGSIWGPNVTDVTVSNNTLSGGSYAVQFSGVTGTSTISGNTISGYTGSGGIVISNGAGTSGLTISGNNISSCSNGIYFAEYCAQGTAANMTTVTISGNTISGSTNDAIKVGDGAHVLASNFVIVNNKISGSSNYGLENQHATEQVTAEKNWWGDATGPDHSSNPHGTGQGGDAVTDDVDFTPWYATATTTPTTENVSVEHNPIIAVSDTILGGINAALAGDTIIVSDGTYTEDLDPGVATHIEISDLTIRSVNGSASTTIQLVDGVGVDLGGGADNFTLGGASGEGFTILSGGGTTFDIQLANAPSGVEISYNSVNTTGNASQGISVGAAGATGLTVNNNAFIAESGDGSIWGPKIVNVTVSGNTFTGPGSTTSGYAVEFAGVTGTSTISGNIISGYGLGVAIFNGEGTSGLTISGNTISGCENGIRLGQYSPSTNGDMTTVTVTQNTLSSNTIALRVNDGVNVKASNFTINYNDFSGNTTYGLKNEHTSEDVTAEKNWWGNISGPEQVTTNPGGLGDEVSDDVDYQPWLTRVFQTVLDDNIAYFGEAIANLDTGWNIFSTPIALDPACDTWGEYIALGDGLSIHGTSPTYAFNSATQSWVQVTSGYQLKTCEAIYVRMAQADISPILYSPNLSVPSMQLDSGWNLVGLANLQDLAVDSALVSVYKVISDLTGYSLAVSPAIGNQNAWIFVRDVSSQDSMQVTKGYWVFMINPGILAGFTFTPMSLP